MVKQSPGISYNSLLGKISSDFGSTNSAQASLSRTLKNAVSLGFLKKKNNTYFITDKGNSTISFEMKNKLLMKLNNSLSSPKINELDSVVEQLQTVIERSKNDSDLLRDARTSATFLVSDLNKLNFLANEKIKHLTYLSKILSKQVDSLKKLNFNDSVSFFKEKNSVKKLSSFFDSFDLTEFFIECPEQVFDKIAEKFLIKSKKPNFSLKAEFFDDFLFFSLKLKQPGIRIYFSSVQIKIFSGTFFVSAPSKQIEKLKKNMG